MSTIDAAVQSSGVHPCRSCGRPIAWGRQNTGQWVPLDPEPHERGQMILLDGGRCHPIDPAERYGADVQARRHRDHRTTCALGPTARTVAGSIRQGAGPARPTPQKALVRRWVTAL